MTADQVTAAHVIADDVARGLSQLGAILMCIEGRISEREADAIGGAIRIAKWLGDMVDDLEERLGGSPA